MAKPRVFVSSTYYDLKHIRASLDVFIESLGFESILSEKGDIAYSPNIPLDVSCYKEVSTADIFTIIIGGRYGSAASSNKKGGETQFFERYNSVTKMELEEAIRRDIPIYIIIETAVYAEYQTFLRNKLNKDINYAHVDSINIFELIEYIVLRPKNNPIKTFDRFSEVEAWLRDQWSGLFRELLSRISEQQQISALHVQINELKDVNSTLKSYLESLLQKVDPDKSDDLIEREQNRIEANHAKRIILANSFISYLINSKGLSENEVLDALDNSSDRRHFAETLISIFKSIGMEDEELDRVSNLLLKSSKALRDINIARSVLGKEEWSDAEKLEEHEPRLGRIRRPRRPERE